MENIVLSEEQRILFWKRVNAGDKLKCPCCNRHAQIYHRHLHHSTARQLIMLYKITRGLEDFVNAESLIIPGQQGVGDFSKAKYWGLIELAPETAGFWRLTELGVRFVNDEATIQKTVLVFDDIALGFAGPQVSIHEALTKKFSYADMMANV